MYIYIYIHIYINTYMFTYTHNQPYHILPYRTSRRVVSKHAYGSALREREREKDRQTDTHTHTHTYICRGI